MIQEPVRLWETAGMNVALRSSGIAPLAADLLVVGAPEGAGSRRGPAAALDAATQGALRSLLASGDFAGKAGESALLYPRGLEAKRVLVVGLGGDRAGRARALAAAGAVRRARELGARTVALAFPEASAGELLALGEAVVLGHHRHTAYLTAAKPPLTRVDVLVADVTAAARAALAAGVARGEAVALARDLASTPGQDLPPAALAERAREIGKRSGARVTVHDAAALERLGMNCVLAVGRGSPHPPCFIELVRPAAGGTRGAKATTLVLVGKGVTFDTGGISLKPREGMNRMKYDMSGAAAVLGVFAALGSEPLPFRLVGLVPSAENAIGGRALKPGDVLRALDGTTIEVTNTDAEGRLLLADALAHARRYEPAAVVDVATLTGAISIALGRHAAGLFTADETLARELLAAGEETGERLWRMPFGPDYLAELRGDTADLVNSNEKREGAACTAAAFLSHFARGMPWAHLDIASTAWAYQERPDCARGPNAFGLRLLLRWLEARAGLSRPSGRVASERRPARPARARRGGRSPGA
jgi:leucyl aminopeptidase